MWFLEFSNVFKFQLFISILLVYVYSASLATISRGFLFYVLQEKVKKNESEK